TAGCFGWLANTSATHTSGTSSSGWRKRLCRPGGGSQQRERGREKRLAGRELSEIYCFLPLACGSHRVVCCGLIEQTRVQQGIALFILYLPLVNGPRPPARLSSALASEGEGYAQLPPLHHHASPPKQERVSSRLLERRR
ncbi:unnamed protein product, partial [Laminaria digitata]